jgi:hypothetical protein
MHEAKQRMTCVMLTKKVEKMIDDNTSMDDTQAIPNEWNDTLNDLEDDSDFEPVIILNVRESIY